MGSGSEPNVEPRIASLGGGLSQEMIDRLLGNRGGDQPPPLMKSDDGKYTFMGLPFEGDPNLMLKNDDPAWRQPQLKYRIHVRIFNLEDETHLRDYIEICQQVADSRVRVSYEKIEYNKEQRTWQVLLRWMDMYMKGPEQEPARIDQAHKE